MDGFFERLESIYQELGTHSGNPCGECRACCSSRGRVTHRVSPLEIDYMARQAGPEVAAAFREYAEGTHETGALPPFARGETEESVCPNYDLATRGCRVHSVRPFSCRIFGRFQPGGRRLPPSCTWKDGVQVFEVEQYYEIVPGARDLHDLNAEYNRLNGNLSPQADISTSDDPMDLALSYISGGEPDRARREMRRMLVAYGPSAPTYRKLAQLHVLLQEADKAYIAFQQASNLDPTNSQDTYYAALMASLLKRHNTCHRLLEKTLQMDGQHLDALRLMEKELRGRGNEQAADGVLARLHEVEKLSGTGS